MSGVHPITLREFADIPVERLKGVGDKKQASLDVVGIHTVLDLVTTYPRRWVDRTNEARIADLHPGEEALVLVTVRSVTKRMTRNRRSMVNVAVGDGSGRMDVVFFNQPWRERQLKEGLQIALFGKADTYRGGLQMANPIVDLIGDRTGAHRPDLPAEREGADLHLGTGGMGRGGAPAVQRTRHRRSGAGRRSRAARSGRPRHALRSIHAPESMREKELARRRLAFDELLRVQLVLVLRKRELERSRRAWSTRSAASSCIDSTRPCRTRSPAPSNG